MNKALDTLAPYAHAAEREKDVSDITRASLVLSQLLIGNPIPEAWWAPDKKAARTHTWVACLPRSLRPGDIVRVKSDAYPANHPLHAHNGREGVVTALRGGIVVGYTNSTGGTTMGPRHQADKLERQVPIQPAERSDA